MKVFISLAMLLCCTAIAQQTPFATDKTAQPAFTTVESICRVIPADVNIRTDGKWSVVVIEQANEAIKQKALNHPAKLRFKVEVFDSFKENGWGYRIMVPDEDISFRGGKIACRMWAYFRPDQAESLSKIHKGSIITLSGTLGRADIMMNEGRPQLSLDLLEAKIAKP